MGVDSSEIRCRVATLEMALRAATPGALAHLGGDYTAYPPAAGAPALIVDLAVDPSLGHGRARGPHYPAFERRLDGQRVHAWRFDADGTIDLSTPMRARFRVAPNRHSMEAAVRIAASIALPRHGALLLHASAIATGNRALVFAGQSGAGKSTIARTLAGAFPHVDRLADELILIGPSPEHQWLAHVSPFFSKCDLPRGAKVPLASLDFLLQAPENRRLPLSPGAALRELCRHILVYVTEPATAAAVLELAAAITAAVPCYSLHNRPGPDVGEVLNIT